MHIQNKLIFDFKTNQLIFSKITEIEKFQGKWEFLKLEENDFLRELKQLATIQSIGSSTRIEGSVLSDQEIQSLLSSVDVQKLDTRDQQEVVGYWEVLEVILENAEYLSLSENYICQLHSLLLKYSGKDSTQRGLYKQTSNQVVATYPDGSQKVIFNTTSPHLVQQEMQDLVEWTINELEKHEINPLIIIGTFIYEFLSIHPFHDGNGRLSRLLTTLLLIKSKYYYVQYVSFEHIIEEQKKEYYQALMACQRNRNTPQEKLDIWLGFFLDCMIELSRRLEKKLKVITHNGQYLNSRQKEIIQLLQIEVKMKVSDISRRFDNVSIHTIKKDLQHLVEQKVVIKKGIGKGTVYMLPNNF